MTVLGLIPQPEYGNVYTLKYSFIVLYMPSYMHNTTWLYLPNGNVWRKTEGRERERERDRKREREGDIDRDRGRDTC